MKIIGIKLRLKFDKVLVNKRKEDEFDGLVLLFV